MSNDHAQMLSQLVLKIVLLSLKIIIAPKAEVYLPCGLHEDKACIVGPLGNRFIPSGDLIVKNWPTMPAKDVVNFESTPDIKMLSKKSHLYRVIGKNNDPHGCWWILGDFPKNKTQ